MVGTSTEMPVKIHGTSAILSSSKHACFQKIHISHSPQSQTYRFPKNSTSAILSSPKHTYFQKIMFFLSFLQKTEKLSLGAAAVIDNLLQDGRKILHNVHIHLQYAYKESMEIQFWLLPAAPFPTFLPNPLQYRWGERGNARLCVAPLLYKSLLKHLCSTQSIHSQQVHKYKHIQ